MERNELPLGLGFALAQNPDAMKNFADLPAGEQAKIIQRAHSVTSKPEMQSLVNELSILKKA